MYMYMSMYMSMYMYMYMCTCVQQVLISSDHCLHQLCASRLMLSTVKLANFSSLSLRHIFEALHLALYCCLEIMVTCLCVCVCACVYVLEFNVR